MPTGLDSGRKQLIQGALGSKQPFNKASGGEPRSQLSSPDVVALPPPPRENGMCVPSTPSSRCAQQASALMPLGNHIPRRTCLCGTFQPPWSQEKIYILLSVSNRSQSFPLFSRRFQKNVSLILALTASSHLFTKINFKHTCKNNS